MRQSFTAGTPVETEADQKPIEEIKVGDKVLAEDPETGEQGYFEVVALTNHPTDEILKVTLDASAEDDNNENDEQLNTKTDDQPAHTEAMEITPDHPVYVEGKGWLWAENLTVGDRLRRSDGGIAKVLAVERVELAEPKPVYNFTVKGPHTYFVLEVGVLVHNTRVCGPVWDENLQQWRNPQGQFAKSPLPEEYVKALEDFGISKDRIRKYYSNLVKNREVPYAKFIDDFLTRNPDISAAEAHAVFGYTTLLFYKKLNNTLRDGIGTMGTKKLTDLVNRALEKLPVMTPNITHYRGLGNFEGDALDAILETHRKGQTVTYEEFISASRYRTDPFWKDSNVRIIFTQTKDARDITDLAFGVHFMDKIPGGIKAEQETLFKTGSRFLVEDMKEEIEDGRTIYYLFLKQED